MCFATNTIFFTNYRILNIRLLADELHSGNAATGYLSISSPKITPGYQCVEEINTK